MRGDLPSLLDDLFAGADDGRIARHQRFRAAGAAAGDQLVAVALQQADALERHAELLVQYLGEWCPVALAVIERAGDDRDIAVGLEADAAHLIGWRRSHFEIVADATAAQQAALAAIFLADGKSLPIGLHQR